jgi:L-rhamnonate dehydratase
MAPMKIRSIEALRYRPPELPPPAGSRGPSWRETFRAASPMSKYAPKTDHYPTTWENVWVRATAEDGTVGYGATHHGRPIAAIVEDHLAPLLVGEDAMATERLWDLMFRATRAYGSGGLTSFAMSAVDLALWDLKGRLLDRPVYELIGGRVHDSLPAYATGNDVAWAKECGFSAFKLARPFGPYDGPDAIERTADYIASVREVIGDEAELMLDCWMAFDVDFTVHLAERLRPFRMRWLEEYLPWQTLAGGEHLFTRYPFAQVIEARCLDILQPDITWVGGLTETIRICHMAAAANLPVILHGGGLNQWGLHLSVAMPNVPMVEFFVASDPGVPLDEQVASRRDLVWGPAVRAVPKDGRIAPAEGPGFGLEMVDDWFEPYGATPRTTRRS